MSACPTCDELTPLELGPGEKVMRLDERYADYGQVGFLAFVLFHADELEAPVKWASSVRRAPTCLVDELGARLYELEALEGALAGAQRSLELEALATRQPRWR